jgi:hypothetical protein
MAITSGTTTALGAAAATLLTTLTGKGCFQLYIDTTNLTTGDELLVEVKLAAKPGGTLRAAVSQVITTAFDDAPVQFTAPVMVERQMPIEFYITQTVGTPKAFDWRVSNLMSAV